MKNKILLLTVCCIVFLTVTAQQPQQQIWFLKNQSINFRGPTPVITQGISGYANHTNTESIGGMYDNDGEVLFYVSGENVVGINGNTIGLLNGCAGTQSHGELSIVPVPNACSKYYIIEKILMFGPACGGSHNDEKHNLCYTIVDMTLNGGQGGLIYPTNRDLQS